MLTFLERQPCEGPRRRKPVTDPVEIACYVAGERVVLLSGVGAIHRWEYAIADHLEIPVPAAQRRHDQGNRRPLGRDVLRIGDRSARNRKVSVTEIAQRGITRLGDPHARLSRERRRHRPGVAAVRGRDAGRNQQPLTTGRGAIRQIHRRDAGGRPVDRVRGLRHQRLPAVGAAKREESARRRGCQDP